MATKLIRKDYIFTDFTTDLDQHPGTGDVARVVNENSVKRAIRNLLLTNFYEVPFQPQRGSNIRALLFENITPATELLLEDAVVQTIENYEPRCQNLKVTVSGDPDNNGYNVTIVFSIINNPQPTSVELVLSRVR